MRYTVLAVINFVLFCVVGYTFSLSIEWALMIGVLIGIVESAIVAF